MADGDKLISDMNVGDIKTEKVQKGLSDVPMEDKLPIEDDKGVDSEVEAESESESEHSSNSDSDSDSDTDTEYECSVCDKKFSGYIPLRQHQKGKKHQKAVLRLKKQRKLREKGCAENEVVEGDVELLIPEPFAVCNICDKQFSGPESYYDHMRSKTHKQKVTEAAILEQVRGEKGEINPEKLKELYKSKSSSDYKQSDTKANSPSLELQDDDKETHDEFECKECKIGFTGIKPFTQHLMGKTHARLVERKKMMHKVVLGISESDETPKQNDLSTLSLEDNILVCKLCSTSFSGPENAMMHLKSKNHSKNLAKYVRKLERKKEKGEKKKTSEEESSPISDPSRKPETSENSAGERIANSAAFDDIDNEGPKCYESYKKYKELMNSLQEEDSVLK